MKNKFLGFIVFLCLIAFIKAQNKAEQVEKLFLLCRTYTGQGQYQKALVYAKKTLTLSKETLGLRHGTTLAVMNFEASLYYHLGQYNKSESLYLQVLPLLKQVFGANHPSTLSCMNNMAGLYYAQNKFDKSESIFLQILPLLKQKLGVNHPNTISTMSSLAALLHRRGKYKKAEALYMQIIQTQKRKMLGFNSHGSVITAAMGLGALYNEQGKYGKAERLFLQLLPVVKQGFGVNHPHTLSCMTNMAELYENQGKYNKAESFYLQILQQRKQQLGANHPDTFSAEAHLASLYKRQGKYDKAKPILLKILNLRKKQLGVSHADTLNSMAALASLYYKQGRYDKAEALYLQTLQLRKQKLGAEHPKTFDSMNSLAVLYQKQSRYSKAEALHLQTLQLRKQKLGADHPDTLVSMSNLAVLYQEQGKYDKAEPLLLKNWQLSKQKLGADHPETLASKNNLAAMYQLIGKNEKAKELYKENILAQKQKLEANRSDTFASKNNLAALYRDQRKYKQAEKLYKENLQAQKQKLGSSHPETLLSMANLAFVYLETRQFSKSKTLLQDWFHHRTQYFFSMLWGQSKEKHKRSFMSESDKICLQTLLSLYLWQKNANTAVDFLNYSLNQKGILLHFSSQKAVVAARQSSPEVQKLFEQLQTKRRALANLLLNPSQSQFKEDKDKLKENIEDLGSELTIKSERFRNTHKPILAKDVQRKLLAKQVCVDFLVAKILNLKTLQKQQKLVATIATKKSLKLVTIENFQEIRKLILKYRIAIIGNQKLSKVNRLAHKLYNKIWQPLQKHLKNKKVIYIIPDGDLHLLPFAALVDHQDKYLLENHNIQIISSARQLTFDKISDTKKAKTSAIFAGPDYGEQKESSGFANLYFKSLPGALSEGKAIGSMLNNKKYQVQSYFRDKAIKENLSQVQAPKILHIATHGFFLGSPNKESSEDQRGVGTKTAFKPAIKLKTQQNTSQKSLSKDDDEDLNSLARSGLAFAGANYKSANKSIATALEIVDLNLWGTELVVLSACDTSLGEIVDGDGVYSLRRAFQEAGAKAVLSTLWPAHDESTLHLMKKFYKQYLKKVAPHASLRYAQLEMIRSDQYSHPYHWANFVMVGIDQHFGGYKTTVKTPKRKHRSGRGINIKTIVSVVFLFVIAFAFIIRKRKKEQQLLRKERRTKRKYKKSKKS